MFSLDTLQIHRLRTFFRDLFLLITSLVLIEAGIRAFNLLSLLPYPPNLGSGNIDFDLKVKYLDEYVEQNGAIECLIMGSSLVDYGVDPDIFYSHYAEITGEDLYCFNFGIGGSKANEMPFLMEFVITRYHPDTIIYATWPRDYLFLGDSLDKSAWIDYQTGLRSARGWLVSNIKTIQFVHTTLNMLWHNDAIEKAQLLNTLENGYYRIYKTIPPGTTSTTPMPYLPHKENFSSLEEIVTLTQENDINLYIVAIPARIESGKYTPRLYNRLGADITKKTGEPYISLDKNLLSQLSSDNYFDEYHMNASNAAIYSRWLAEKIASLRSQ